MDSCKWEDAPRIFPVIRGRGIRNLGCAAAIVDKTRALRIDVDFGPVVSADQLKKVEEQVNDAVSKGATVLAGGKRVGVGITIPATKGAGIIFTYSCVGSKKKAEETVREMVAEGMRAKDHFKRRTRTFGNSENSRYGYSGSSTFGPIDKLIVTSHR